MGNCELSIYIADSANQLLQLKSLIWKKYILKDEKKNWEIMWPVQLLVECGIARLLSPLFWKSGKGEIPGTR